MNYNDKFIEVLGKMESIMSKKGEPFKARAYKKAQETIMLFQNPITDISQLNSVPNIGASILEKLNELVKTGSISLIEEEKLNPVNIFIDIYGVGPKKAEELVKYHFIKTIAELRDKQLLVLNDVQRAGLKYYEDLLQRIPRKEIEDYKVAFEKVFDLILRSLIPNNSINVTDKTEKRCKFEIVGSYRRGHADSGDIDVIITASSEDFGQRVFKLFIDVLVKQNIILEVLSRGQSKCLVITSLYGYTCARRVDFLYAPINEYAFSTLYFTGSKLFNTMMRQKALDMGYTLNEHGISRMVNKVKDENMLPQLFKDEREIFEFFNMTYQEPKDRNILLKKEETNETNETNKSKIENKNENNEEVKETNIIMQLQPPLQQQQQQQGEKKNITKKRKQVLIKEKISIEGGISGLSKDNSLNSLESIKLIIDGFKKGGIKVLDKYLEKELKELIVKATEAYHNNVPIMSDNEYDIIDNYVKNKYVTICVVGSPIETSKTKAQLPYEMGSMDKIKPDTGVLANWINKYKGSYVLSCKLDGVSGLYYNEGESPMLYTRGDGKVGQNISHLLPFLKLPLLKDTTIRGEFIIPKGIFDAKYKKEFANPRNMVAGIINHKHTDPSFYNKLADIRFVAYEVIKPVLKPSEQNVFLKNAGIEASDSMIVAPNNLTNELLSQWLINKRAEYLYEIDGIVVTNDKIYERSSGNPEHAFAFKMVLSEQCAEAKVVDVIWSPSKDGYLKPRVQIEPIMLCGVKIEYATGFNGAFIKQNKIGIGALIEIIRSGDVIPHIKSVTVCAQEGKMPDCEYKWNETGVDIILENANENETVLEKNITMFFKGIEVEGLSSGTVNKLIKAGYNSVKKIISMKKEEVSKIDGLGEKSAEKICNGIKERLRSATMVTLMSASNLFGRGFAEKKLQPIMDEYPDILVSTETKEEKIKKIMKIKGIALKSAELFVLNIESFNEFLSGCKEHNAVALPSVSLAPPKVDQQNPLYKKTVILTGFRDKDLLQMLKDSGAIQGTSVTKNTFAVITKGDAAVVAGEEETGGSAKVQAAQKLGIPIFKAEDFMQKYLIK